MGQTPAVISRFDGQSMIGSAMQNGGNPRGAKTPSPAPGPTYAPANPGSYSRALIYPIPFKMYRQYNVDVYGSLPFYNWVCF